MRSTTKPPCPLLPVALLVALSVLPLTPSALKAEEARTLVRAAREEIEAVRGEIQRAEPYPGGGRWMGRLRGVREKLLEASGNDVRHCRWFERAIEDFADRKKEDAKIVLDDVASRLSLMEDSMAPRREETKENTLRPPDEVKSLLRGSQGNKAERPQTRQRVEEDRGEVRREQARREEAPQAEPAADGPEANRGKGATVSTPTTGGGFSSWGWVILAGLVLTVLAVGVFFYLSSPRSPRSPKPETTTSTEVSLKENDARQIVEESPANLWRQADGLASEKRFRDALRLVYLAVLASLHRRQFIRFEPTRTNGEYVRQLRLSEQAPSEWHDPFQRLTQCFETAWYGERLCEESDYRIGRTLADRMQ